MKNISLLDCTLRDGGYINDWNFGNSAIRYIIEKLCSAKIDFIECGYLTDEIESDAEHTIHNSFKDIQNILPDTNENTRFAVMIDYGKMPIDKIPSATDNSPILRVCFHKCDVNGALDYCKKLIQKGHKVFVQPMNANNYSDEEYISLIETINSLKPECFYIVDSFGVMELEMFKHILLLTDKNLDRNIILGYHAHNNLQQAYGNSKYMAECKLVHNIIIDACAYGMGRGAGNLNLELFASYLNNYHEHNYNIDNILDMIDEKIKPIFVEHYWGYSLPFYLSALNNCHPSYAEYFADKNTLTNRSINQLLASLPDDVKNHYSNKLAEEYYTSFQNNYVDDSISVDEIGNIIKGRDIVIIAPGKSISDENNKIQNYIRKNNAVTIAINVIPRGYSPDFVFCANEKRLKTINESVNSKLIISSNIKTSKNALVVNYSSYLGGRGEINDNPTLMMIRLLIALKVRKVSIAGFDGYRAQSENNYYNKSLALGTSIGLKLKRNPLIKEEIAKLRNSIEIEFITRSLYE